MQYEPGTSCPLPNNNNCPDHFGTLPSCANLAVPFVPMQQRNAKRYDHTDALSNGTLFPGLNLPFHLKTKGSSLPTSDPLTELQALEFVVLELGLYLDTHPDDTEAFSLFRQYAAMERAAKTAYESKFGPLLQSNTDSCNSYRWLEGPWPWNFERNEVK